MTSTSHVADPTTTLDLKLTVSDLLPAAGLSDPYDDTILALCDTSFVTPDLVSGTERFCHQLRHATDADTVYLCQRQSLELLATTSACNDIHNEDTVAIHSAVLAMVSDLAHCETTIQLPSLRVFPDTSKLAVTVIPVGAGRELLAVLVDADEQFRHPNQYCSDAIDAIYQCQTSTEYEGFAPTNRQLCCYVFDALNLRYSPLSNKINTLRFEMFVEDLAQVDVQFEKILELEQSGDKSVWGWEVVASHRLTDRLPEPLFQTAEQWTEQFRTQLDLHLLHKAAYRYKEVCEAENLIMVSQIKPLCLSVYPQTLQQAEYIDSLRELTEKFVMHGAHLVFEISEKVSLAGNKQFVEQRDELQQFAEKLAALRSEFNIRVALNEFGAGNSSLTRLMCLDPDIIKMDKSISQTAGQPVMALLEQFSALSDSRQSPPLEVIHENQSATLSEATAPNKFHSTIAVDALSSA